MGIYPILIVPPGFLHYILEKIKTMKKTTYYSLVLFTIILFSTACKNYKVEKGNGDVITKDFDITDFDELDIAGFYEVFLTHGETEKITIETDENLFEFIDVSGDGNTVVLDTEDGIKLQSKHGIKVYITYRNLSDISMSGAGVIKTENTLTTDDLKIKMSGAGVIELELKARALEIRLSGAGSIKLSGNVEDQALKLSGAGSVDAYKLRSKNCVVSLAGVGSANVFVTKSLDASVSGIGSIKYKGSPNHLVKNVSGIGKIKNMSNDSEEDQAI